MGSHVGRDRALGWDVLHLFALSSFGIAQPLFDLLGNDASFFVARRSKPLDLFALTVAVILVPPVALAALELIARLAGSRVRRLTHALFVLALLFLVAAAPLKRALGPDSLLVGPSAGALALAALALYLTWAPARSLLSVLAPVPLAFGGLFLFGREVHGLWSSETSAFELADVESDVPVVFVIFDELPLSALVDEDFEIDTRLFPNFARLTSTAHWLRNAAASDYRTKRVVPSILTGLEPDHSGRLPVARMHPRSLFTLLGRSHRIVAYESVTQVCPSDLLDARPGVELLVRRLGTLAEDVSVIYAQMVVPAPFGGSLPEVTGNWGGFRGRWREVQSLKAQRGSARDRRAWVEEFIARIDGAVEPTLYYLHVLLPHTPWIYLPSGVAYTPQFNQTPGLSEQRWGPERDLADLGYQRFFLQLGYADHLLGRILDRLEETALFDRCALVVCGDHGANFEPLRMKRDATRRGAQEVMHVPLFVKLPEQRTPSRSDVVVSSTDVLPTLADAIGIELPWPVDGHSAFDPERPEPATRTIRDLQDQPMEVDARLPEEWPGLALKRRLFGPAPTWTDVHGMGPHPEWVGRLIQERTVAAPREGLRVTVHQYERYASIPADATDLPAYIGGTVEGPGVVSEVLAIALNGVVWAVRPTFDATRGRARYAAFLPAKAFRPGYNQLELFTVSDDGSLEPLVIVGDQ